MDTDFIIREGQTHVPVVLGLFFSICLYLQLVANASCISSRHACNNFLMEEIFRVSTNSVRVLRQLTMGRVLINLR